MPEGDTIHKLARALGPKLVGRVPDHVRLATRNGVALEPRRIIAVTARGKHLFIEFEQGIALRTHLGMYGSWHRYALTEVWKKPAWRASVVLEIGTEVYVCFDANEIELLRTQGVRDRSLAARLACDLLAENVAFSEIPQRARDCCDGDTPIVDVLLDQRIACGIGNVYKSEILFLLRCHPLTALGDMTDESLIGLYRCAAALLHRNLAPGPRITRCENDAAGRLWVYRRKGQACFTCRALLCAARLGRHQRSTYWCPECQPEAGIQREEPLLVVT